MNWDITSLADLRAFARYALLEDGIDIDIINISKDGVKINSFKKLVKKIYDLGFKEGKEARALAIGEQKRLEKLGKIMKKHERTAKYISEHNLMDKKL